MRTAGIERVVKDPLIYGQEVFVTAVNVEGAREREEGDVTGDPSVSMSSESIPEVEVPFEPQAGDRPQESHI